jgi:putative multicomponent Na+:H+ antiporter subunit B
MTEDFYLIIIVALLPLSAIMIVSQVNPYYALVTRGILGAIAALVYALFGAADVALTEALVGTMLSITLYGIAVRSSMCMRLGVITKELNEHGKLTEDLHLTLSKALRKYHLRLELVPYEHEEELQNALMKQEVHSILLAKNQTINLENIPLSEAKLVNQIHTRIPRLYEIMNHEISIKSVDLIYINQEDLKTHEFEVSSL